MKIAPRPKGDAGKLHKSSCRDDASRLLLRTSFASSASHGRGGVGSSPVQVRRGPIIDADDGLFLIGEGRQAWLPAASTPRSRPCWTAPTRSKPFSRCSREIYPAEQVFAALDHLKTTGYLAEDGASAARPFHAHSGRTPVWLPPWRGRASPAVRFGVAFGDVEIGSLTATARQNGIRSGPTGRRSCGDGRLPPPGTCGVERAIAGVGKPWLLVKPMGMETWIGPLIVPGRTACWECLAQRLRGHRKLEQYLALRRATSLPIGAPAAASIASTGAREPSPKRRPEITRWIGSRRPIGAPRSCPLDERPHARTSSAHSHSSSAVPVLRRPRVDGASDSAAGALLGRGPRSTHLTAVTAPERASRGARAARSCTSVRSRAS